MTYRKARFMQTILAQCAVDSAGVLGVERAVDLFPRHIEHVAGKSSLLIPASLCTTREAPPRCASHSPKRLTVGANVPVDRESRSDIGHVVCSSEERLNCRRPRIEADPPHI